MRRYQIAPSILSADFADLKRDISLAEEGGADLIHIDVMDGHFVPNITIGPFVVEAVRRITSLPLDVHLMINNPDDYISSFADAGADMISVHAEGAVHLHRSIQNIKATTVSKAGIALNPATPLNLLDHLLFDIDFVLIMTVNPGFGGQEYIGAMTEKIATLRKRIDESGLKVKIEVDGGVNRSNIAQIFKAGCDILVAGSAVFGAGDPIASLAQLKAALAV